MVKDATRTRSLRQSLRNTTVLSQDTINSREGRLIFMVVAGKEQDVCVWAGIAKKKVSIVGVYRHISDLRFEVT